MLLLAAKFLGLAVVIIVAGIFVTKFADRIADVTGIGRSLAGLLLLATATSLPELSVGCNAAVMNEPNLTVGDLMGSSLVNLLILAVLDLANRTPGRILTRAAAAHALSATASMLLTALAMLFILLRIQRSIGPMGVGTLAVAGAYLLSLRLVFFDQQYAMAQQAAAEPPEKHPNRVREASTAIVGYLMCAGVILGIAPMLAGTAKALAEETGMGTTFFGTAFVSTVTSLPELVTTLAAVRMGAGDLAIGNILGSNSFNMAALVVIDAFYDGPLLASVDATHAITAAAVIVVTSVTTMGLLYRAEKRYWVVEPDAVLVILLILLSFGLVYTH